MSAYGDVTQFRAGNGAPAPIVVPTTTVVFSRAMRLNYGQAFGIWYQAGNGSGTANMKIQLEQSYRSPATEGSADANYVVATPDIETALNDTNAHVKSLSPVPMKYCRLKITGLGSNPADASLTMWIFIQEFIC